METKYLPDYAIHPGILLKDDLEELNMSQAELSRKSGIAKTVINEIIKGKRSLNADIAIKLEQIIGLPAKYWINLQALYDEAIARMKQGCVEEIIFCDGASVTVVCNSIQIMQETFSLSKRLVVAA